MRIKSKGDVFGFYILKGGGLGFIIHLVLVVEGRGSGYF